MNTDRLRIAITADLEFPVPPKRYGGIEWVIDMLIGGLVARGHEVTLFGHPDSDVSCRLVSYTGYPYCRSLTNQALQRARALHPAQLKSEDGPAYKLLANMLG